MKKKKYIVNGQVYEIPDEESGAFLKDFPDAKVQYDIEGKQYEIPHQETEAFETDMGLKKKSGGNDGSNISETALSNGQADGEIPIVSLDAENKAHPIDLAAEYTGLKNKTIIEGTGEGEMEVPDVAGRKKGEDLKEFLKIQHGIEDPENLYEENKDFPQNASDWKFTDESGVEVQPYSKDNRLKLRETNPTAYYDKINGVKTQYAIAEKTGNWSLANEFINLKKSAQNVDEFVGNVNKQKEIINTVFDDKDEREKANERLKSEAYVISPAAKGFTESYKNSGLSDKLSPYEYSGLLTLKAFEPEKYEQTVNFINTPITEKYSHQLPTEALRNMQAPVAIGTSFESPQKNVNGSVGKLSQQTVDEKLGLETRMRELSDIGQSNYFQSIQKDNAELNEEINKLDDADENKTLLINKYNSNVSDLNKAIAESENDDAKYPLTTALKFDKQVADMTQQEPGLLNTAAIKFALQTDKPRKAFENIFGDSPSLQMQRVGEEESNSKFTYLPEEYIRQNSPVIPVYPKELEKEIKAISANKEMPFQERQAKIKELLIANQSKIKTITNPNEGKSKNFFSKATAYTMADFMGNIGGMAFTMAALPIKGLPKEMVGMGLLFHNDHYTEAVKKGIPNPNEYANLHSGIDMLAGSFGTQYQTVKKLISTNPSTKNILNGITEEMWDKVVSKDKAFISKISNAAKSSLKDNTKMVAMWGGAVPAFHNVANNAFGNENKSASDILNESVASMKEMAVGQLPLAVAGVYSGYKRESTLRKSLLWDIGDNADIELQRVKDLEATGKLTPEKATQRTQTIKEVSKLIDLVPSTDKKGKPLNDEARMDYLYNLYVKNKVKTESGLPEKQKVEAEKTGMVADHINNEILDPSTDKQLESRLNQIEKELEPEVGADGKTTPIPEKEKTKLEAEKEAINQVIEERKQPEPVKEPSTVSKITADAEDLLKSVDSGSKPAFVTKNMERIAKENGIEVTDKTTPDEIINQLKSKQESKPSTVSSGDALKDVESTEKALRKIKDDNQIGMNKSKEYPKESALFNEVYSLFPFARKEGKSTTSFTDVSEAYHKAKRDGSNPEFVKAVEDLINKEQPIAPKQEAKPTVSSEAPTPKGNTSNVGGEQTVLQDEYGNDVYWHGSDKDIKGQPKVGRSDSIIKTKMGGIPFKDLWDAFYVTKEKGWAEFFSPKRKEVHGVQLKKNANILDLTEVAAESTHLKNKAFLGGQNIKSDFPFQKDFDAYAFDWLNKQREKNGKPPLTKEEFKSKDLENSFRPTHKNWFLDDLGSQAFADYAKEKGYDAVKFGREIAILNPDVAKFVAKEQSLKETTKEENKPLTSEQDTKASIEGNERQPTEKEVIAEAEPIEVSKPTETKEGGEGWDFDKMMAEIPNSTGEVKEYLSGPTINRDTVRKTENDQKYTEVKLLEAAQHGQDIVEVAKSKFGNEYVEKTLDYLDKENIAPDVKALAYVSLENEMEARVTADPTNVGLHKLQDLVRAKSQLWLRKNSIAINAGRLRVLKEVGFDIRKATDDLFSPKEKEDRATIEKLVQADAETIQKQSEENVQRMETEGMTPEVERKISEGVEKEINKIYEQLPKEKKSRVDKAIAALEKFQKSYKGRAYDATGGIPLAIIDAGITTIKLALKAGVEIANAIELGINKIKEKYGKKWENEKRFREDMVDLFKKEEKDLNHKEFTKTALINTGFGKTIKVKTKEGIQERQVVDWKKLAGEEGSVTKISENVAKALATTTYSKEQINAQAEAFVKEYTDIRASVIEKGLNEIGARNKTTVTPAQKSASKRLSELYNYGLFDKKNLEEYETVLHKALGINSLTGARVKRVSEIAKAMGTVLNAKYQGKKIEDYQVRAAEQHIQELIRDEITDELSIASIRSDGKIDKSKVFYKITDIVGSYMDLAQMMGLNTIKNAILENPISGAMENVFNKIGNRGAATKEVRGRMTNVGGAVFKELATEKGSPYGDVTSTFVTRGSIERDLNKLTDNKAYQVALSAFTGKAMLSGVDSYYKANTVERNFIYNLQKVLTQDRKINGEVMKGMSKDEARNYIAERISKQTYEEAQSTARDIIAKVNKGAGRKILNDSELFVTRMANDIVKGSLVTGGKITPDMVTGSYEAAYEAAGRGLGHVANNIVSKMISGETGRIESQIKESLKDKDYSKAAYQRMYSILFKNILNPYVGGGTNWMFITLERGGGGIVSGLGSMIKDRNARKMDLTTETGINNMKEALYSNQKIRDKFIRGAVGGSVGLLTYLITGQIRDKDDYEKWRERNPWATKYTDILYPQVGQYFDAKDRGPKELKSQVKRNLNMNEQFDKGQIAWDAFSYTVDGKTDKALGKMGQLNPFGAPTPWRMIRDVDQIVTGATGGDPYRVPTQTPESFWEGWWRGGMVDYMGQAPHSENTGGKEKKEKTEKKEKKLKEVN